MDHLLSREKRKKREKCVYRILFSFEWVQEHRSKEIIENRIDRKCERQKKEEIERRESEVFLRKSKKLRNNIERDKK